MASKAKSGVAAIVLAAGMSRRMGTPKQLLLLDGKPLLERTLENVRRSDCDQIVMVLGFAAEDIQKQISLDGIRVVVNPDFEQGMGTSLRAGIAALDPSARAAVIVLADQPFVQPETIDALIAHHRVAGAQIVIPTFRGFRGNPVLLDRAVFPELRGLAGDVGCRAIFGSHTEGISKPPVSDPGILLDVDSREDLEKLNAAAPTLDIPLLECKPDLPPERPEIVLVGRDPVVFALAKMGQLMRFTVTIVDPFLRLAEAPDVDRVLHELKFAHLPPSRERYAVVASRGQFDEEALAEALIAGIPYVALLANRRRAQELATSLRVQGFADDRLTAIRAPAGLDIGAESAEEIALSIVGEIVAVRKRKTQHL